jgi:hypothetical protein
LDGKLDESWMHPGFQLDAALDDSWMNRFIQEPRSKYCYCYMVDGKYLLGGGGGACRAWSFVSRDASTCKSIPCLIIARTCAA